MAYLEAFLHRRHLRLCSGSTVRCCFAGSVITTSLQRSNSWPHISRGMMYALCFCHIIVLPNMLFGRITPNAVSFSRRRTTMRKLKPTSITWSRLISYAGHVRQQWSTTLNIRTASFVRCFLIISCGAPGSQTWAL